MEPFQYLSVGDLELGIDDLLGPRLATLQRSPLARAYEPHLRAARASLSELGVLLGGKPLAEVLHEQDVEHDGFGNAIWWTTQAYLDCPGVSEELRASAKVIRAAFVPARRALKATYATEAKAAADHRPDLARLEGDLRSFPLAGGKTLYDWVAGFLSAGESLGDLLGARGNATAEAGSRKEAGPLRSSTLGLLNRLRRALADDLALDATLPAALDGELFAYLDTLESQRAEQARAASAARKKKAPSGVTPAG